MAEPPQLSDARRRLARVEADLEGADAAADLAEALTLLEEVAAGAEFRQHRAIASNLASTYTQRVYAKVKALVEGTRALSEPELEHFFQLMLTFDRAGFGAPEGADALKIELVRRLIDRYYEGHSPAQKRKALERLMEL
jgi:hypothetical protein